MGFLDNSGDIILDAVLTDLGRERMARGDGSFRIAKFTVGDDEIDYGKYDLSKVTSLRDIDILKTPVLEAFTDNGAQIRSKLVTIARNDLLFLPILKLVNGTVNSKLVTSTSAVLSTDNVIYVTADLDTSKTLAAASATNTSVRQLYIRPGVIRGDGTTDAPKNTSMIVIDQGLDTIKIPQSTPLDADLTETQYLIQLDDRLGQLQTAPSKTTQTLAPVNFVDDDRIANYYVHGSQYVTKIAPASTQNPTATKSAILGPLGTRLMFAIRASTNIATSTTLFDKLGSTKTDLSLSGEDYSAFTFKIIDSIARVTGVTTGYRLDIPIRYIKKV